MAMKKMKTSKESSYMLYGKKLVRDDSSLAKLTESLLAGIEEDYGLDPEDGDYHDRLSEAYEDRLEELGRTDIDYGMLLERFAPEIGAVIYDMEDYGEDTGQVKFFGTEEQLRDSFERIASFYVKHAVFGSQSDMCRQAYEHRKRSPKVNYNVYPLPLYDCPECGCGIAWSPKWRCKCCPECGQEIDWSGFPPEECEEFPSYNGPYDWRRIDAVIHEGKDPVRIFGINPYTGEMSDIGREIQKSSKKRTGEQKGIRLRSGE